MKRLPPYRIHKYQSAQDKFYVVEEDFPTGWHEVSYDGKQLSFSDPYGAVAFIDALDGHKGGYVREDLIEAMVTN